MAVQLPHKRQTPRHTRCLWDLIAYLVPGSWKSSPAQCKTMAKVVAVFGTDVDEMVCISMLVSQMPEQGRLFSRTPLSIAAASSMRLGLLQAEYRVDWWAFR